jgi:hypothetical protein
LLQGSFGPTTASIDHVVELGDAAAWVADQLGEGTAATATTMPKAPTLLRAHYRRRTSPRVVGSPTAGGVPGACDAGSRWNHYAFDKQDIGNTLEVLSVPSKRTFEIRVMGTHVVRTESANFLGAEWPMVPVPVLVGKGVGTGSVTLPSSPSPDRLA